MSERTPDEADRPEETQRDAEPEASPEPSPGAEPAPEPEEPPSPERSDPAGLSARERRRQEYLAKNKGLNLRPSVPARKIIVPLVVIVGVAAIGFAMINYNSSFDKCPGHWHATMKAYVNGDEVDFTGFDLSARNPDYKLPISYHMHSSDSQKWMWHFEPQGGAECIPFGTPLGAVDMDVKADRLSFDGVHEGKPWAGTWTDNGTSKVQLFHSAGEGWKSISASKLNDRQLLNGEKVLILYGDYPEEQVRAYQQSVPTVPGGTITHPQ